MGRCGCGRPAAQVHGEDAYCAGCLPGGEISIGEHRRIFALLRAHGVPRASANAMLVALLDFERAAGMEFEK